jgi:hypothetical protein
LVRASARTGCIRQTLYQGGSFTEGLAVSEPGTLQCSLPLAKGHRYTPGAETEAGVTGIGTLGT